VKTGAVRSSGDNSVYKRFGGRGRQGTDGGRRGGDGAASTDERWAGLQVSVLLDGARGKTSEDTVQERRRRRRRRRVSKWFCDTFTGAATAATRCGSFVRGDFGLLVTSYR
jgi:hypothetical protein